MAKGESADTGGASQYAIDSISIELLLDRIKSLEAQVKDLKTNSHSSMNSDSHSKTDSGNQSQADSDDKSRQGDADNVTLWIPEVCICTLEMFKNRYNPQEAQYAVEALVSGPNLRDEVLRELALRKLRDPTRRGLKSSAKAPNFKSLGQQRDRWIERVRVHSQAVLRILGKVLSREGMALPDKALPLPTTFIHPFQHVIYYHEAFKNELALEARLAGMATEATASASTENAETANAVPMPNLPAVAMEDDNTVHALTEHEAKEVQCYIDFVGEFLIPRFNSLRADDPSDSCHKKVRFNELWYLFKHGELLYHPSA